MRLPEIKRLHLTNVTLPQTHPLAGDTCSVYAYLILHPDGPVLVDTGVGSGHDGIKQMYRPIGRPLEDALRDNGVGPRDIAAVINSHLHFDHCGENRLFPETPIYVQEREYQAAQEPAYTIPEWVDAAHLKYERLDGEAEIVPGLRLLPTPGHTAGHQSVLLEGEDGRAIIAGQAAYTAQEFARSEEGHVPGLEGSWDEELYLETIRRLRDLRPDRVYFSHDRAVWESDETPDAL